MSYLLPDKPKVTNQRIREWKLAHKILDDFRVPRRLNNDSDDLIYRINFLIKKVREMHEDLYELPPF